MKHKYGIALFQPKDIKNLGTIIRNCFNFDVDFICLIGDRYKRNCEDTLNSTKHIPTFFFTDMEDFIKSYPKEFDLVRCEVDGEKLLTDFIHPKNCIYIFGGEDRSVPPIDNSLSLKIETQSCLNISVSNGIVLYDRQLKINK